VSAVFSVIVAADQARGIGKNGTLPWRLPGDMAFYKRTTLQAAQGQQNAVIMGRKTFESIPAKFRPLKNRLNLVLTRNADYTPEGAARVGSLEEALQYIAARTDIAHAFVIGGGELYRDALLHPACARVIITRVHATFDCDTGLAPFEHNFVLTHSDGPHTDDAARYTFETYERRVSGRA